MDTSTSSAQPSEELSAEELRREIRRLAPFHHAVELPHGLTTYDPEQSRRPIERTRLDDVMGYVQPVIEEAFGDRLSRARVLDVAANCGGFSVAAVRMGAREVVGIDVVDHYLEQANLIRRALGLENLSFHKLAIEELDPEELGLFDLTFCFDILYHLENPVLAMKRLSAVTARAMIIETLVAGEDGVDGPTWEMNFLPPTSAESFDISTSLWRDRQICQFTPTSRAVTDLLGFVGFEQVRQIPTGPEHALGNLAPGQRRAIFYAERDTGSGRA